MNILVIGSGGREHAIIRKLKESPKTEKLWCAPGNGGIAADAECVAINAMDIDGVVDFAKKNAVDLVFVAPDDPLAAGMVDALEKEGIRAFGPRANAAIIESSKVFSKNLMKKYGIPTADYAVFSDPKEVVEYVEKRGKFPVVIKADGLALGKGVIIAQNFDEAISPQKIPTIFRKQRRQHGFLRSRVLCDLTTWNEITKSDTVTLEFKALTCIRTPCGCLRSLPGVLFVFPKFWRRSFPRTH